MLAPGTLCFRLDVSVRCVNARTFNILYLGYISLFANMYFDHYL